MKILVLEPSALHLGFVGCYGNDWVATPNLDRLAAESIVFDQHLADCPTPLGGGSWPGRSAATGRYRFLGQVPAPAGDGFIRHETVANLAHFAPAALRWLARPDRTVLWIEGPSLAPPWQLPADLLAVYVDEDANTESCPEPPCSLDSLDVEALNRVQTTYAAVVTYYDAQLGRLLDALRDTGRLDDLLVCVTARCGLPLGEHELVGVTRPWLHDELVHVPLILRLPQAEAAGQRVTALTQPVDLWPTLREFLGLEAVETHGRSLWPLIRGEAEQLRPYAVSALRLNGGEEWLLRTPERALLLPIEVAEGDPPRRPQLYLKPDDRWEANDLAPRSEDEVERLEQTLREFMAAAGQPGPLVVPPLPDEPPAVTEEMT